MVNLLTGALFLLTVKQGVHDSAFFRKQQSIKLSNKVIKLVTSFLHVTASCNALRMVTQYMLMFLLGITLTSDEYCKCLLHTSPFQLNKPFESIFTLYSLVASTFW